MALNHLAPYEGDWNAQTAAHLLRRTGFGAAPTEIAQAVEQGLEATVESLFAENAEQEAEFVQTFDRIAGGLINFSDATWVQSWWTYRMLRTATPLREKLTLFWHGHFATSVHKVEDAWMLHRQIELLRSHAFGAFRDLVLAIAKDAAMSVYLDGQSNTKEHPNENFARELMELFTCGIGNYAESDVREAARAFSGWNRNAYEFQFHAEQHDDGRKTFLGKRGRFDGTDVIDILMQQPATPRFMARKLLRFFAAPQPSDEVIVEAAERFDRTQLNVKWFLRELFLSKYFFSEECHRTRISSPAEFVIGTVRSLGARVAAPDLVGQMTAMGQELLAPPNVKGWDGEQKWINSATWPARVAFAEFLTQLYSEAPVGPHLPSDQIVSPTVTDPQDVVSTLAARLGNLELSDESRRDLTTFLVQTDAGPNPAQFKDDEGFRTDKTRQLISLMLSLPESQAC